jgi:hypothetical protein
VVRAKVTNLQHGSEAQHLWQASRQQQALEVDLILAAVFDKLKLQLLLEGKHHFVE